MSIYTCKKCGKISARRNFIQTHTCNLKDLPKAMRSALRVGEVIHQDRYERYIFSGGIK